MIATKRFTKYMATHTPEIEGILWLIISCFWFSVMATLIRHISEEMSTMQMVFFRSTFAVLLMLPWAFKHGLRNIRPKKWNLYIYRSFSGLAGVFLLFYGLSVIPLAQAISLTFTAPLITALLAIIFLGEKVRLQSWLAMMVGFSGVLVILRPGGDTFQLASFTMILATVSWSVSSILVKKLTATEHPRSIVFVATTMMIPLSLPMALMVWQMPTAEQMLWLFVLAWVTNQAQFALTHAYAATDVSVVLPFDFCRLIFISILAYVFFGEVIDVWTAMGAVIILSSSVYIARKSSKTKQALKIGGNSTQ